MTRPDEPTEALPTRALPVTGDADAAEPTVHLVRPGADADSTVSLAVNQADSTAESAEPTTALVIDHAEATVRLAVDTPAATVSSESTVHLPGAAADQPPTAEPTVHLTAIPGGDDHTADLAASATPTPPDAEPTVHLRPGRAADTGEVTVHLPAAPDNRAGEQTVSLSPASDGSAGEATVHLRATPDGQTGEPTVSLHPAPAGEATVQMRPASAGATGQATVYPRPSAEPPLRPGAEPTASWQPIASWQPTGVPHRGRATGTAATGAGAYPDRTGPARAVSSGSAPGGELRFGPGVPATPPPAPPWPTAPPIRPRPAWRRVVSVLSTLLTVVLLLAVGLYLWQRLRPLEVEGVTVAVPRPAGVACDVTVDVVATVHTNGRGGTIRYQWFRSDAPPGAVLSERVGSGQQTAALTLKWTFTGVGTTTGIATVNIVEPATAQASTRVVYRCPGG
ncbi:MULTISPECIES: hypothetical protein [unclassified Micromonospora]|uniref:hypothetical protein n=1 Tax=unclassified Micromonospora TaxID=2617518 RepID=UPI001C2490E6|nr:MULTISPECIES: hypothetical protein [unclassified Micromonospora]MBU8861057.1 hypothetical protein [Micromonospora sp. WMMB482]MDM4780601.1 hypothetical protein [Micromonospora sp. b486]